MAAHMNIDDILDEFQQQATAPPKGFRSDRNISNELLTAMLNERMAPELLPYKHNLMDEVLRQLSNQQQYLLDSHEYGDSNVDSGMLSTDFKLQLMIIETDIERLTYMLRLYLRTRLQKVDNFTIYYMNETAEDSQHPDQPSILSTEESEYMHKHFKILTQLYNNSFLKKLPQFLTLLDDEAGNQSMVTKPDLELPVFIKVKSDVPIIISLGSDEELELAKGGIYVVKYRFVKKYIEMDDIELI